MFDLEVAGSWREFGTGARNRGERMQLDRISRFQWTA